MKKTSSASRKVLANWEAAKQNLTPEEAAAMDTYLTALSDGLVKLPEEASSEAIRAVVAKEKKANPTGYEATAKHAKFLLGLERRP